MNDAITPKVKQNNKIIEDDSKMKPLVVMAGNKKSKIEKLRELYIRNKPDDAHDLVVVYNGEETYDGADIYCENDLTGKDIAMYHEAVRTIIRPFYFFLNDDIVHIRGKKWLRQALEKSQADIVGVQANLSSLVPLKLIEAVGGKQFPSLRWGARKVFIRCSAFACRRSFFLRLWKASSGDSDYFEKHTIKNAGSYALFDDPFYIFDSNLQPYYSFTKLPGMLKKPFILWRRFARVLRSLARKIRRTIMPYRQE